MTRQRNSWLRFILAGVLLAGTALFLRSRSKAEQLPPREEMASFPRQVGDWVGRDVALEPEIREVLGAGEFLVRIYQRSPQEPYLDLFLAYFPTQRSHSTIHSPQNCLPGAGWVPVETRRIPLAQFDGKAVTVNRYVIAKGADRQLVLYWYQAHHRVVASEYWAKFYLVADAIRLNRSDGALVRIITPLARGESVEAGQTRVTGFARDLAPLLDRYIPQ